MWERWRPLWGVPDKQSHGTSDSSRGASVISRSEHHQEVAVNVITSCFELQPNTKHSLEAHSVPVLSLRKAEVVDKPSHEVETKNSYFLYSTLNGALLTVMNRNTVSHDGDVLHHSPEKVLITFILSWSCDESEKPSPQNKQNLTDQNLLSSKHDVKLLEL